MTLIPLRTNWDSPVRHVYAYQTEILTARSGREQRRALRNKPRHSVEFEAVANQAKLILLRRFLADLQGDEVRLPDEIRRLKLASAASAASPNLPIASTLFWPEFVVQDVLTRERTLKTLGAGSTSGNWVTTTVNGQAWAAGSRIFPTLRGRLETSLTSRQITDTLRTIEMRLDVTPGSEDMPNFGAAVTVFNGREVFTHKPNWARPLEIENTQETETVDFGDGVIRVFKPIAFPTEIMREQHVLKTDAEKAAVLGLFHRSKGRRGEFYRASGVNDLTITATVANGAKLFFVGDTAIADAYAGSTIYRAIEIRLKSGVVLRFRVAAITVSGGQTRIETVETAPYAIAPADVDKICWMPVCRFVSDSISVEYITDSVARTTINYMTIEAAP